ncbi:MAG: BrnT family toxin [Treponemataceae bacterium]|nr:BrnT family toxin [Treponemataceae bacterium]
MTFEWDENKNKINKKKHDGVSFEIAARVFLDEKRIEKYDALNSKADEDRYQTIGMVEEVLFVAFTERGADRIRIISARPAEQEEIDEYFENYDAR